MDIDQVSVGGPKNWYDCDCRCCANRVVCYPEVRGVSYNVCSSSSCDYYANCKYCFVLPEKRNERGKINERIYYYLFVFNYYIVY